MGRKVDERFSNGNTRKRVENVGQLIDELSRLPRDIPLIAGIPGPVEVVLWNASGNSRHGPHVSLQDVHED